MLAVTATIFPGLAEAQAPLNGIVWGVVAVRPHRSVRVAPPYQAPLAGSAPDTIRMAAPKPVRAMNPERLKIFTGSANPALAEEMCGWLGLPLGKAKLRQFADGSWETV